VGLIVEKYRRKALVHTTFTPGTPVNRLDLFSGRHKQINTVLGAVFSPGQHVAIYGERGVGKTSLANLIYDMVVGTGNHNFIPARINCSAVISYHEIWREIFKQIETAQGSESPDLARQVPDTPNSEDIRGIFDQVNASSIVVIDEFDRMDQTTATSMADTIKTLSDRATDTTLVIVGVGDSIDHLIKEHESVLRALVQIRMPRMSLDELRGIIENGLTRVEMAMESPLRERIAKISKGLPHYAHLLSKHAALQALDDDRLAVDRSDYEAALKTSVDEKSQTLGKAHSKATHSPKANIFSEVLLACALATDENGLFSAKDVRGPLRAITKKRYDIQAYIRHLNQFSQEARGPVLRKEGRIRRFQYSFVEPMMQPYALMKGLTDGLITEEQLSVL
jgi:Cdc6-like AAA superfamily ATPase